MTIRSQRYIVDPVSACPAALKLPGGAPQPQVPLDMEEVARSAWGEILQTAPQSTSLFAFIEDLLEPGAELVWRGKGPGRGTEMRRSFSGLFGRFFARAYLETYHDFTWFAAIDGDNFHLSPNWRVKRATNAEMPDWVCARPGALGIGEAKGSHQKGNAKRGGAKPGPIKTAEGQIRGVRVQKRTGAPTRPIWRDRSVKGWAVMSRWGLADPPRAPFLYALDPATEGEALTPMETEDLVQAVARTHVEQTAIGLGLLKPWEDGLAEAPRRRIRVDEDDEKRLFAGTVITPFGPLGMDLDRAKELAALLPDPDLVRFVGIDENLFSDYLQGAPLVPRKRERIGNRALVGEDGLVVAPVSQILDLGFQTDAD